MIEKPLFIIGAPRSGTSILFRACSLHAELWHLPRESHVVFEGPLHPRCGFVSNRITAADITPEIRSQVLRGFEQRVLNLAVLSVDRRKWITDRSLPERVRNRAALVPLAALSRRRRPQRFRLLEKTPKNSLRVSALQHMFPDARFVFLQRNARQNIDSLIAGWRAADHFGPIRRHRFCAAGYPITNELQLRDYDGPRWKFALIPGWQQLRGASVADVAAAQYFECNRIAVEDLACVDPTDVLRVDFSDFIANPLQTIRRIFRFADLQADSAAEAFAQELPRVNDATPQLLRRSEELRFSAEVDRAIEKWEQRRAA